MWGRCLLISGSFLFTVLSHGQEVTINVPVSQARLLEVDAGPDIPMAGQDSVMLGEDVEVVGGAPGFTYVWKDQPGNSFAGQFVFASSPGVYSLTVNDANNCTASDSLGVIEAVSAQERSQGILRLYPNPTAGIISVPVIDQGSPLILKIISPGGEIVYAKTHHPAGTENYIILNLENLHGGLYFIRMTDRISSRVYSFIKK
jgi:hypothetical protein